MDKKEPVALVIPAFNEATVIKDVLISIPKNFKHKKKTYSITPIVVNDGSKDATSSLSKTVPGVVVIDHLLNSGAGAATRTGLAYAAKNGFQFAATMDSDGQHAVEDVIKAIQAVIDDRADLVIGSRLLNSDGMPWYKVMGNTGLSTITSVMFSTNVKDTQSGLKAMNRSVIERLTYHSNGYTFCSEMLWRAKQLNFRILEVPIRAIYTDYSMSKGQSNWNALVIIGQLIKRKVLSVLS